MSVDSFLIKLISNEIAVYEYENGDFLPLKYKGEEIQEYKEDIFWSWWQQKVEYNDKNVSFVVITDREEFSIPKNISLSRDNSFLKIAHIEKKLSNLAKDYNLLSFPKIEDFKATHKTIKNREDSTKEKILIKEDTLASYFRRKTDEYRYQ